MADKANGGAPVDIVGAAFNRATELKNAKDALYEQMAANRRFLRDLKAQGLLSAEQATAVDTLYPPKARAATAA